MVDEMMVLIDGQKRKVSRAKEGPDKKASGLSSPQDVSQDVGHEAETGFLSPFTN
jgi:hypothetical protein